MNLARWFNQAVDWLVDRIVPVAIAVIAALSVVGLWYGWHVVTN